MAKHIKAPDGFKYCYDCNETKPIDWFGNDRARGDGRAVYCKPCNAARSRKYQNTEAAKQRKMEWRAANKDYWRYNKYGITPEKFAQMLKEQDGQCAICKVSPEIFCVDHDHNCCPGIKSCGKCVRLLLCGECNIGLGKFKDNLDFLRNAVKYLESFL